MILKRALILSLGLLASSLFPASVTAASSDRPNIVFILSDDYGWGSAGCYGAPSNLKTPNLDKMATEGRRFTQAYAPGSVCSPTRYGLMTGRYYWRTSIKDGEVLAGNAPLHIETTRLTLASLCKIQGYTTAAFGKWHLGLQAGVTETNWNNPLNPGPLAVGFDSFYGLAANPWNGPHTFIENENLLGRIPGQVVTITGSREGATTSGIVKQYDVDHIMENLTGKVTDWIGTHHDEPFFIYFAPNAVHEPVAPNPRFRGNYYGKYGDFINELDWSVGQVMAALEKWHLTENTLVFFSSDNGGVINKNNDDTGVAMKAGLAINGALRGGKHDIWEGGFREPFLVRWPGHVPANTVSNQVICLTDVLASLAGILKIPLPGGPNAEDSLDVSRAFFEEKPGAPVRDHVVLQAADATYAIRRGDWKLVERVDQPNFEPRNKAAGKRIEEARKRAPKQDELFNLGTDPAETKNICPDNPELTASLRKLLISDRQATQTR